MASACLEFFGQSLGRRNRLEVYVQLKGLGSGRCSVLQFYCLHMCFCFVCFVIISTCLFNSFGKRLAVLVSDALCQLIVPTYPSAYFLPRGYPAIPFIVVCEQIVSSVLLLLWLRPGSPSGYTYLFILEFCSVVIHTCFCLLDLPRG